MAILISSNVDLKIKTVKRNKEGDVTVIHVYAPNARAPCCLKQVLMGLKGDICSITIFIGDFSTSLFTQILPKGSKISIWKAYLYPNVYCSCIHNWWNVESTQKSNHWWLPKENMSWATMQNHAGSYFLTSPNSTFCLWVVPQFIHPWLLLCQFPSLKEGIWKVV